MVRRHTLGLLASFQDLYGDLLRSLTWRTGNPDQAADLIQETYCRLAVVQENGPDITNPKAYVLRTATNLAIDRMRQERRQRTYHIDDDIWESLADSAPLPDAELLSRERLQLLDAALRQLPAKPREALLLSRVEGLTQREIALRLGVSESMVIKYIAQALRHCRSWQQDMEAER